jgi:hypothetical protein
MMSQTLLAQRNTEIIISKDMVDMVRSFAEKQYTTTLSQYAKRNQSDPTKIKYDCMIGKIGEWGIHGYFISQGYTCTEPDMNIYPSYQKNWNKDMVSSGVSVTIKSQSYEQSVRFGTSWTFQYSGNGMGHKDKIFDSRENEYIFAACVVKLNEDGTALVSVKTTTTVSDLFRHNLFGEPKSPNLVGIKKVVYYDSILDKLKTPYVR